MNIPDTTTPRAKTADYVIGFVTPSGETKQICVECPSDHRFHPLRTFLEALAHSDLIARGGGGIANRQDFASMKQAGLAIYGDNGQPRKTHKPVVRNTDFDDPFADDNQRGTLDDVEKIFGGLRLQGDQDGAPTNEHFPPIVSDEDKENFS